ncbi:hypothetical protein [Streptomyces anandii]|uniref:hypothetical protein n=1 Tax=Streptomyces anandii TaxID=285454 RepID=UPI0016734484|nr:hypothetical protein [Streptomyces anandii]GGY06744.1 hypothetical protein GCM10010510_61010 [Streptomyces anandii JCM 4720]
MSEKPTSWWRSSEFKVALVTGIIVAIVSAVISKVTAPDDPPELVTYKVRYRNNTGRQQDNVLISAEIPQGSEYVMGSTYIANSATDSQWKLTNDGITARGLNIGSYAPGGAAYLKFRVRPKGKTTFTCSSNGEAGSVSVSAGSEIRIWTTC